MPQVDNNRFNRREIKSRFSAELGYRYSPLDPQYSHENGLLGFKLDGVWTDMWIDRMTTDAFGVPSHFYLVDGAGGEVTDGSIYAVVDYLDTAFTREDTRLSTDFEFVVDQAFAQGDVGVFTANGRQFFMELLEPANEDSAASYGKWGAKITDLEALSYENYGSLLSGCGVAVTTFRGKDACVASERASGGRVKARKVSEIIASSHTSQVRIFDRQSLANHIAACTFKYRPFSRVHYVRKATQEEVASLRG